MCGAQEQVYVKLLELVSGETESAEECSTPRRASPHGWSSKVCVSTAVWLDMACCVWRLDPAQCAAELSLSGPELILTSETDIPKLPLSQVCMMESPRCV